MSDAGVERFTFYALSASAGAEKAFHVLRSQP
jgi:hypothetical protein